jgi:hypothetical protein
MELGDCAWSVSECRNAALFMVAAAGLGFDLKVDAVVGLATCYLKISCAWLDEISCALAASCDTTESDSKPKADRWSAFSNEQKSVVSCARVSGVCRTAVTAFERAGDVRAAGTHVCAIGIDSAVSIRMASCCDSEAFQATPVSVLDCFFCVGSLKSLMTSAQSNLPP